MQRYIGLMSGTSVDGVDAVLAEFDGDRFIRVAATTSLAYPRELRDRLLELGRHEAAVSLEDFALLDRTVAEAFSNAARQLIQENDLDRSQIDAIGSHGQTIFHRGGDAPLTLQLGDPSWIAARCEMPVIADFRRFDIAAGGQGAPLMPAFHRAVFSDDAEARAVLNLGGIANLTLLPAAPGPTRGFDVGPANALLDQWCAIHLGTPFDTDGAWAGGGAPDEALIAGLLADPYFNLPPPKSTGRGDFNLRWAQQRSPELTNLPAENVQASFLEVAARSIADALLKTQPSTRRLFICGGGIRNLVLLRRLRELLEASNGVAVLSTDALGIDPQAVEGAGFAWLAMRRMRGLAGNLCAVTGARYPVMLGGIYGGSPQAIS